MKRLENKTVFITGGLSGIGKACAMASAREGANVVIADLKSDKKDTVMEEIQRESPKALFIECDVSKYSQVESAIQQTISTFKTLDVALNNAGIGGEAHKVGDMTEEAWLKVIGVNLNGVFNCMKHELVQMVLQKKGVIVNISSILGKVGFSKMEEIYYFKNDGAHDCLRIRSYRTDCCICGDDPESFDSGDVRHIIQHVYFQWSVEYNYWRPWKNHCNGSVYSERYNQYTRSGTSRHRCWSCFG